MNSTLVPALKEWAIACRALEEGRRAGVTPEGWNHAVQGRI